MIKGKIVALLLAATVVTGTGTFGTHALLTQESSAKDSVNITIGKVAVSTYWDNDWNATLDSTEVDKKTAKTLEYSNVKVGDTFERTICIVNRGTLKANVKAKLSGTINRKIGKQFNVAMTEASANDWSTKPDFNKANATASKLLTTKDGSGSHYMYVKMKVTVTDAVTSEDMGKTFKVAATDFLNVTATQTK